jgi:cell division protein FtsB
MITLVLVSFLAIVVLILVFDALERSKQIDQLNKRVTELETAIYTLQWLRDMTTEQKDPDQ